MIDLRASMIRIVSLLEEELLPHMEFEGRILHPIIDRFACEGPMAFSASMEYEHRVVDRRIGDLAASARDTNVDARTFARRFETSVAFPVSLGAIPGARRRSLWGGTEGPGRIQRGRP